MRTCISLFALLLLFLSSCSNGEKELPYLGPTDRAGGDTVHHRVPAYTLTDQSGQPFIIKAQGEKVIVADFFFTTCPTICPKMTEHFRQLQEKLKEEGLQDKVWLISHTVDPKHDSAAVLKAYAEKHKADTEHWKFLTGDKEKIYTQAAKGYLLSAGKDSTLPGGFLHSGQFTLLDRQRHIRGYYDGTKKGVVDKVLQDIRTLTRSADGS